MIAGAVVPVASGGRVQVAETLPAFVHVQPVPVADTNVTPAGSVSVTVRFAASDGPMSVTLSVYATELEAVTAAGPVLVIARSADWPSPRSSPTRCCWPGSGPASSAATDAVLVRLAACAGAVTVTVIAGADAPVASAGRVQVTETLPAFEHAQPVPVAHTNVTPAGSVSVTVRFAASDGPLFVTASE